MERAVSLPTVAHDGEGSSAVARCVSSRTLRSLPGTRSVAEVSMITSVTSYFANTFTFHTRKCRLSRANIKIGVETAGTTAS